MLTGRLIRRIVLATLAGLAAGLTLLTLGAVRLRRERSGRRAAAEIQASRAAARRPRRGALEFAHNALLTISAVGIAAMSVTSGYAAFQAFAGNTGSSFAAGSVAIQDNDSDVALYSVTGKKPGEFAEGCIRVTYLGTLASTLRLYRSAFSGGSGLESYLTLDVKRGSGTAADCSDFAEAATVYTGTLAAFPAGYASAADLADAGGSTVWDQNDAVTYRIRVTLRNDFAAQGLATGTHGFTWEARSN